MALLVCCFGGLSFYGFKIEGAKVWYSLFFGRGLVLTLIINCLFSFLNTRPGSLILTRGTSPRLWRKSLPWNPGRSAVPAKSPCSEIHFTRNPHRHATDLAAGYQYIVCQSVSQSVCQSVSKLTGGVDWFFVCILLTCLLVSLFVLV